MKNKFSIAICLIIILAIFNIKSYAQQGTSIKLRDFELWSAAELKYKVNKKLTIGLEQQLRLKDDATQVDQAFTQFFVKKQFIKSMHYGLGLRYIRDNDNQGDLQAYENHFRFHFDLGYNHKVNQFKLKYRLRLQTKNQMGVSKADGDLSRSHIRLKISTAYNIKKWKLDPEVSAEIFNNLRQGENFDKFRFTLGTKYKMKTLGAIGAFYRIEQELNATNPITIYIAGLKYTYTLKRKQDDQ